MLGAPYTFGAVAANHALSDCHAMGAAPVAALATAVVPLAGAAVQEEELYQMMAGAGASLRAAGCALVGGHSSEGAEAALGERGGRGRGWAGWGGDGGSWLFGARAAAAA